MMKNEKYLLSATSTMCFCVLSFHMQKYLTLVNPVSQETNLKAVWY